MPSGHQIGFRVTTIMKPIPKETPSNLSGPSAYVHKFLNDCLPLALLDVCQVRPRDPIEYIARWLYRHVDCEIYFHDKVMLARDLQLMKLQLRKDRAKRRAHIEDLTQKIATLKLLMEKEGHLYASLLVAAFHKGIEDTRVHPKKDTKKRKHGKKQLVGGEEEGEEEEEEEEEENEKSFKPSKKSTDEFNAMWRKASLQAERRRKESAMARKRGQGSEGVSSSSMPERSRSHRRPDESSSLLFHGASPERGRGRERVVPSDVEIRERGRRSQDRASPRDSIMAKGKYENISSDGRVERGRQLSDESLVSSDIEVRESRHRSKHVASQRYPAVKAKEKSDKGRQSSIGSTSTSYSKSWDKASRRDSVKGRGRRSSSRSWTSSYANFRKHKSTSKDKTRRSQASRRGTLDSTTLLSESSDTLSDASDVFSQEPQEVFRPLESWMSDLDIQSADHFGYGRDTLTSFGSTGSGLHSDVPQASWDRKVRVYDQDSQGHVTPKRPKGSTAGRGRSGAAVWFMVDPHVLVCRHPVLGELRSHIPQVRSLLETPQYWDHRGYNWAVFYDHELYSVLDPHADDELYSSRMIQWTDRDWLS